MSHSPLPFAKGDKYASWSTEITDKDGRTVAAVWTHGVNLPHKPDEKGLANLDLIVKAVNHHAKLVEALQAIANDCHEFLSGDDGDDDFEDRLCGLDPGELMAAFRDTADALLAEINGETDDKIVFQQTKPAKPIKALRVLRAICKLVESDEPYHDIGEDLADLNDDICAAINELEAI
jgi:hypothetical protein